MKKLAAWLRSKGLPLLGHAAGAVVTGGKTLIPGTLKKLTDTLGLPSTATQQEILAILSGTHEALTAARAVEANLKQAQVKADVDKYLGQLEYDLTALQEAGQTNRVDAQSGDKFISWARPTGLYLSFAWTTGWLYWIWQAWSKSSELQEQLILGCVQQASGLEGCLTAVHGTPLPITTLATSLKTIPIWALIAPFAPILSYYPLRTLDKLITKSVLGNFKETGAGPVYHTPQYALPAPQPAPVVIPVTPGREVEFVEARGDEIPPPRREVQTGRSKRKKRRRKNADRFK